MPLRVAVVCPTRRIAALDPGGAAVHLRGMAEGFARAGAEVEIWVARARRGRAVPSVPIPDGVRLREARRGRLPGFLRRRRAWDEGIDAQAMARQAEEWAREFRPDLVYERLALFASIGSGLRRRERPWVLEANSPVAWEAVWFEGAHASPSLLRWEGRTLRAADRVVVVSRPLADHAIRRGVDPGRIDLLPNGVRELRPRLAPGEDPAGPSPHVAALSGAGPRGDATVPLSGPVASGQRPFVLGYEGTFKPWQGTVGAVADLRDLAIRLAPRRLAIELWGDGPDRAAFLDAVAGLDVNVKGWGRPDRTGWDAAWVPLAPWPPAGGGFREPPPARWFCPLKEAEAAAEGLAVFQGGRLSPPGPRPMLWEEIARLVLARALGRGQPGEDPSRDAQPGTGTRRAAPGTSRRSQSLIVSQ